MRTQAEFHQRLCFRQAGWSESILDLILPHRFLRRGIPAAIGSFVKHACLDQRLLNLFHPVRPDVTGQVGVMVVVIVAPAVMVNPYVPPSVHHPAGVVRFSFLPGHQSHAGDAQNPCRDERSPSDP